MSEFEKIELEQHPRYILGIMMIVGMKDKNKITDGEKQRIVETMETNNRWPKAEVNVNKSLKKDYTKTKIKEKETKLMVIPQQKRSLL